MNGRYYLRNNCGQYLGISKSVMRRTLPEGTFAGVVAAISSAAIRGAVILIRRLGQVQYTRKMLEDYAKSIIETKDIPGPPGSSFEVIPAGRLLHETHKGFRAEMHNVLAHIANDLSQKQRFHLHQAFSRYSRYISNLHQDSQRIVPVAIAHDAYAFFTHIPWLKLEPITDRRNKK